MHLSREAKLVSGIILLVVPTIMYGGITLLGILTESGAGFAPGVLSLDETQWPLWRAGHAHAGVWVISILNFAGIDRCCKSVKIIKLDCSYQCACCRSCCIGWLLWLGFFSGIPMAGVFWRDVSNNLITNNGDWIIEKSK